MRAKLLINDVHLGVQRTGGTTMQSAHEIREYLRSSMQALIMEHTDKDLIIGGDLFDAFNVNSADLLAAYFTLCGWLDAGPFYKGTKIVGPTLFLGRGNHDAAKDSAKLSSFDFLGELLKSRHGSRVMVIAEPAMIDDGIYMLPHLPNQDLFNLALENVPADAKLVLIHANYDNGYTVESDHSLNVSPEQAQKIIDAGASLVFAHEHQARSALDGRVAITGNQWPSSIADCQNNPDGQKAAHIIDDTYDVTPVNTWYAEGDFVDTDWRLLDELTGKERFIRCSGTANADEAATVVSTLAKFRKDSEALVITNAVKIAGVSDVEELAQSMEDVKGFDVMGFLFEQLDPDQTAVVKRLQAEAA